MRWTSYEVSGDMYYGDICFGDRCTTVDLFVGNTIDSDALMFDVDGAYGIIGMGPYSPLWSQFLEPETTQVNYSIKIGAYVLLEDEPFASSDQITDYYKTEIEFAQPVPDYYDDYSYVWVQGDMADQKFQYTSLGFGKITYGENPQAVNYYGDAESEYFENIGPDNSGSDSDDDIETYFMLNTNVQGAVFDEDTWEDFEELFMDACSMLSLTCSCTDDAGGYCLIDETCES